MAASEVAEPARHDAIRRQLGYRGNVDGLGPAPSRSTWRTRSAPARCDRHALA